jgi:hypothetical protein
MRSMCGISSAHARRPPSFDAARDVLRYFRLVVSQANRPTHPRLPVSYPLDFTVHPHSKHDRFITPGARSDLLITLLNSHLSSLFFLVTVFPSAPFSPPFMYHSIPFCITPKFERTLTHFSYILVHLLLFYDSYLTFSRHFFPFHVSN